MGVGNVSKRILLGRKLRSSQLGETLLPKRIALPVFASDALSSVAYAPDEVFIMLAFAGASAYVWSWKIALAVALVMLTVVASYRQTVHAYPSGGGDYEVATVNLGRSAGTTVASALLVDYILTVAVSISSASQYASAAVPAISGHEVLVATAMVIVLVGDEPAWRAGVRHALRRPDVPVHRGHPGDVRLRAAPARPGDPARRRERRPRPSCRPRGGSSRSPPSA